MDEEYDLMALFVQAFHISPDEYWNLKPRTHAAFVRRLNEMAKE